MITDAVLTVVFAPIAFLLNALPDWTTPQWLQSGLESCEGTLIRCNMGQVGQKAAYLDRWMPFDHVFIVLQGVLPLLLAVLVIRLVRMVVSALTGGGGSAA